MSNPTQFVLQKALHFTLHKFYGRIGDVLYYTSPKTLVYRSGDLVAKFDLPQTSVNALIKSEFLLEHVDAPVVSETPETPEVPTTPELPETPEVPATQEENTTPDAPAADEAPAETVVAPVVDETPAVDEVVPDPAALAAAAKANILAAEAGPVEDEGEDEGEGDTEAPSVAADAAPAEKPKTTNPRRAKTTPSR